MAGDAGRKISRWGEGEEGQLPPLAGPVALKKVWSFSLILIFWVNNPQIHSRICTECRLHNCRYITLLNVCALLLLLVVWKGNHGKKLE